MERRQLLKSLTALAASMRMSNHKRLMGLGFEPDPRRTLVVLVDKNVPLSWTIEQSLAKDPSLKSIVIPLAVEPGKTLDDAIRVYTAE